jgi:hypothetical protein
MELRRDTVAIASAYSALIQPLQPTFGGAPRGGGER